MCTYSLHLVQTQLPAAGWGGPGGHWLPGEESAALGLQDINASAKAPGSGRLQELLHFNNKVLQLSWKGYRATPA